MLNVQNFLEKVYRGCTPFHIYPNRPEAHLYLGARTCQPPGNNFLPMPLSTFSSYTCSHGCSSFPIGSGQSPAGNRHLVCIVLKMCSGENSFNARSRRIICVNCNNQLWNEYYHIENYRFETNQKMEAN